MGRTCEGHISKSHVTFKAVGGSFVIGNFPSEKCCPGIPLDPEILSRSEKMKVDWVELEFKDLKGKHNTLTYTIQHHYIIRTDFLYNSNARLYEFVEGTVW